MRLASELLATDNRFAPPDDIILGLSRAGGRRIGDRFYRTLPLLFWLSVTNALTSLLDFLITVRTDCLTKRAIARHICDRAVPAGFMMTASTELPGHFVNRSGFLQADQRSRSRKQTFRS